MAIFGLTLPRHCLAASHIVKHRRDYVAASAPAWSGRDGIITLWFRLASCDGPPLSGGSVSLRTYVDREGSRIILGAGPKNDGAKRRESGYSSAASTLSATCPPFGKCVDELFPLKKLATHSPRWADAGAPAARQGRRPTVHIRSHGWPRAHFLNGWSTGAGLACASTLSGS